MFLPFGNQTENPATVWKAGSTFRGSYDILSSCVLTLILCIWTAVHINIAEPQDLYRNFWHRKQLQRKAVWLTLGVIAPELV